MEVVVTLAVGLLGGGALASIVVAVLNRRKTGAETLGLEVAAESSRVERALTTLETVLKEVRAEVANQRELREQDRKDFTQEIMVWQERSVACDERLAAEVRAREHEAILARERDVAIADLQKELTLALSDLARLSKRAEDEDRRARDVVAAAAAAELVKHASAEGEVLEKIQGVQTTADEIHNEVTTGNASTLARLAELAESRRIQDIPEGERTASETEHLDEIPIDGDDKETRR